MINWIYIVIGSVVGYYFGIWSGVTGGELLWEIGIGGFVGLSFTLARDNKDPYMIVGFVAGLIIAFGVEYFAGSEINTENKLIYGFFSMFIVWNLQSIWKFVLVGGLLGGMIGFILGMQHSYWFGSICLPAGFLNAVLTSVLFSIIGMACGSLFVKAGGVYLIDKLRQAHIK